MNLISYSFLVFFLSSVLLYHLVPRQIRSIIITIFGMFFYMWASPILILYPVSAALMSYLFGLVLSRADKSKKLVLASGIILVLLPLLFTKYLPYCFSLLNHSSRLSLVVPIGISYFTLEAVGYLIDVYREPSSKMGLFRLFSFFLFFPKILSGPICKPGDLIPQIITAEGATLKDYSYGIIRMLSGLFKKAVIADNLAKYVEKAFYSPESTPGPALIICAVLYSFQLYYDFTGCMDIVVGAAKCFGISLPENFKTPYFSSSIKEFWNRWHISLSKWYRDYVYFPLGGSRKGSAKTAFNILVIFILSGLWHGAGITFLLWGLWHGLLRCSETLLSAKGKSRERTTAFGRLLKKLMVFIAVSFGWIIFRSNSITSFARYIKGTAFYWNTSDVFNWFYSIVISGYGNSPDYGKYVFFAVIIAFIYAIIMDLISYRSEKSNIYDPCPAASFPIWIKIPLLFIMILLILSVGNFGSSSFIYYKFD